MDEAARKERAVTKLLYESGRRDAARREGLAGPAGLKRTSDLLSRVQDFLPKIAKANEGLREAAEPSRGQESGSEGEAYVEMSVALAPTEVAARVEDAICKAAGGGEDDEGERGEEGELEEEEAPRQAEQAGEEKQPKKRRLIEEL